MTAGRHISFERYRPAGSSNIVAAGYSVTPLTVLPAASGPQTVHSGVFTDSP